MRESVELAGGAKPAKCAEDVEELRYVARQPILDLRQRVVAYELLSRTGPETAFHGDRRRASREMLDNLVLFGLNRLTGGRTAFVNCTAEVLTEQLVEILNPEKTVLEILENVEPTAEVIEACRRVKAHGFRLALDDFEWRDELEPLVELADYVKVDVLKSGARERRALAGRLEGRRVNRLAEKVETQREFEQAREDGFTFFQGYFFCRPTLLPSQKVPANQAYHFRILHLLREEPIDFHKVGAMVKRDAALTFRLLRLANSPLYGMRQEVQSVEMAMVAIGEEAFRRLAMLAIAGELSAGRPAEVLRIALVRARFCEQAAPLNRLEPTEQYLLGLLSLLPAMLRIPMESAVEVLPVRDEIRHALCGGKGPERTLLGWMEAHEHGDWPRCEMLARDAVLNEAVLARAAREAVVWVEQMMCCSL
ncbi:MAG TPA: HDOD domain-containing protein [Terracidiphilus sp.]|nr:HDOD domain-containing protein [Terracidiphilus sp.]